MPAPGVDWETETPLYRRQGQHRETRYRPRISTGPRHGDSWIPHRMREVAGLLAPCRIETIPANTFEALTPASCGQTRIAIPDHLTLRQRFPQTLDTGLCHKRVIKIHPPQTLKLGQMPQ